MFPTLSHIIDYLFGFHINLPIQTFGFFEVLAFVFSYLVFKAELKRKESLGIIKSFRKELMVGKPVSIFELVIYAILGFLIGYKLIGAILQYGYFAYNPLKYIFSLQGNIIGGIIVSDIFIYLTYTNKKSEQLPVPKLIQKEVHPYQLMNSFVFWCGFWGFIGAKIFSCLENPSSLIHNPIAQLFSFTGWTFYGGLFFGAATYLYIGYNRGMKLIDLADIGSPGMMLAYATGRIGCHLSGDGDWGIINQYPKPSLLSWIPDWTWSFNFPHNVLGMGKAINNCQGDYCYALPQAVFPTSFYEATICLLLFFMLWFMKNKIRLPGLMFCLYLISNGTERFLIEKIKVNQHYSFGNLSFSQAELIGFCMIIGGVIGLMILCKKNNKQLIVKKKKLLSL